MNPPLPEPAHVYKKHHDPVYDELFYTDTQMQAYGKVCRDAALEEAASMLLNGELRGTYQDMVRFGALLIDLVKQIRRLK